MKTEPLVERDRPVTASDSLLSQLRIRNLSAAIASGRVDGCWQLGIAVGRALTGETWEDVTHG